MKRLAVALVSLMLFACPSDDSVSRESNRAGESEGTVAPPREGLTLLPPEVRSGPRDRWEMRLWIGLVCPRDAAGTYEVAVDAVEMFRDSVDCRNSPGPSASLAFTLGEGRHALTVRAPDGRLSAEAINVTDDTWVTVTLPEPATFEVSNEPHRSDLAYDPSSRPPPAGAAPEREVRAVDSAPAPATVEGWRNAEDGEIVRGGASAGGPTPAAPRREGPEEDWIDGVPATLRVVSDAPVSVILNGRVVQDDVVNRAFPFPAGDHRVTLRAADGTERQFSVSLDAGGTRTLVNAPLR